MVHMTIDMPEAALAALRTDPENFARQMRLAAAVKWYELRRVILPLIGETNHDQT